MIGDMFEEPPGVASANPARDYADGPCPGASPDYLVVPRSLAQSMPLRWQQVFVGLLADLHDAYGHLEWPQYQVIPSRYELLADMDEGQLAAAGYVADVDEDGQLVIRDGHERPVIHPHSVGALVPVDDPIPGPDTGRVDPRAADDRI